MDRQLAPTQIWRSEPLRNVQSSYLDFPFFTSSHCDRHIFLGAGWRSALSCAPSKAVFVPAHHGGRTLLHFDLQEQAFVGSAGTLAVAATDAITHRLAMLLEGECQLGPKAAAAKFGLSRQRYFQLRQRFLDQGAGGLASQQRGPKHNYRRTDEVVRHVIRHRFLDPDASAEVITQKLVQTGSVLSCRSVERIIQDYGLQKKTLPPSATAATSGNTTHHHPYPTGSR
jgi:hypothetical protein